MPSKRPSIKQAQKAELEARLGESVISREEAAVLLGTTAGTLNAEPNSWPAYYSRGPKQVALYPASLVREFAERGKAESRRDQSLKLGRQPWPEPIPARTRNAEFILKLAGDDEQVAKAWESTTDD